MLGRALHRLLLSTPGAGRRVIGAGHTRLRVEHRHEYSPPPPPGGAAARAADGDAVAGAVRLVPLDLLDYDDTTRLLGGCRPDVVVHCAAERRPDAFERDPGRSARLNAGSTRHLAEICARLAGEYRAAAGGGGGAPGAGRT